MMRWVPALLLILVAMGCADPHASKGPQRPTEVSVSKVKMSSNTDYVDFTGRTEPKEIVEIQARVTGYLMKVMFDEGKLVKEGDVLYQLDDRTYKADLAKYTGEVERYDSLRERLKSALNRARRMKVGDAISREEYDKISGDVEQATAAMA